MKLIFANRNYSSWSLRAWLVLRHFEIPFEEEMVLLSGDDWQENIRTKSPSGRVPVLVDGDLVLPETIAIIEYLADMFPQKAIWPSDRKLRARARAASAEMHAGFTTLRNAAPMNLRASHPGKVDLDAIADDLHARRKAVGRTARPLRRPVPVRPVLRRRRHVCAAGDPHPHLRIAGLGHAPRPMSRRSTRCRPSRSGSPRRCKEPWVVEDDEIDVIQRRARAGSGQ